VTSASELQKELATWEDTLERRQVDEARRVKQAQKARREAIDARGTKDAKEMARRNDRADARLASTRRAIHNAESAVSSKKKQIKAAGGGSGRNAALGWCKKYLYKTEVPHGSNCIPWIPDHFGFGCVAWCGIFCGNALKAAGLKPTSRIASVYFIEQDAKNKAGPFSGWTTDYHKAKPGDLVVIGGHGVHVEMVRAVASGGLNTYGGNTSGGTSGSQSNGGGSYPRFRPSTSITGIAQVRY
jgi:hypothetical protein